MFKTKNNIHGERLERVVKDALPDAKINIISSLDEFIIELNKPLNNVDVTILHADSKEILSSFLLMRERLLRTKIILILPNMDDFTISKGHLLYPRFVTTSGSDFSDVSEVLKKMDNN